jgi:hypothetical protein
VNAAKVPDGVLDMTDLTMQIVNLIYAEFMRGRVDNLAFRDILWAVEEQDDKFAYTVTIPTKGRANA